MLGPVADANEEFHVFAKEVQILSPTGVHVLNPQAHVVAPQVPMACTKVSTLS